MTTQKLVIVESPAKAKTINRFLGKEYKVIASMGHIRDLPSRTLGVDVNNQFQPTYQESPSKSKIITEIRSLSKKSDEIYLATDPDREGESIAWHLWEIMKNTNKKAQFRRVVFHEITESAIKKAFVNACDVDMNLVDSQQARRILDRLVGYQVSPLLWSSIERGISAGRVQSVALRLVVEREQEIINFKPDEYWNLWIDLAAYQKNSGKNFRAKLAKINQDKATVTNEITATQILNDIDEKTQQVLSCEVTKRSKNPPPPFITSTLQQIAGSVLRFSSKQTMQIAQELYEGIDIGSSTVGLITYMRTDSVNIAKEAQDACRHYISLTFGEDYIPRKPPVYHSKSNAQEAHEAIRPTDVQLAPSSISKYLTPAQNKLYTLIWKRFVASQMSSAAQRRTTVETAADNTPYVFRAVATETIFQGYLKLYGEEESQAQSAGLISIDGEEEQSFPTQFLGDLKKGDSCIFTQSHSEQKFTEPPPRFSEATLVKELEANGIGRPSTYASIVNTVQERNYVKKEKGKLIPSELGFKVNHYLVEHLPKLFQVGFTAAMEAKLDKVEEGEIKWTKMLHDFYFGSFLQWLDNAKHQNAPEKDLVKPLFSLFDQVSNWEKNETKGKKAFNDAKFIKSLHEQFEKNGKITEKQWNTLIRLAQKYQNQLPDLSTVAKKIGISEQLKMIDQEKNNQTDQWLKYQNLFEIFNQIQFDAPVEKGKKTYNDQQFVFSLQDQIKNGKMLSPKQLAVFSRMINKYADKYPNLKETAQTMGFSVESKKIDFDATSEENIEIQNNLNLLELVKNWEMPKTKGRRSFDDQLFYESLKKQFSQHKPFSVKQKGALKKLVAKYENPLDSTNSNNSTTSNIEEKNSLTQENTLNSEEKKLFDALANISTWEPSQGKFNDQSFFESLKKQFDSGKKLSFRQIGALRKLVTKYTQTTHNDENKKVDSSYDSDIQKVILDQLKALESVKQWAPAKGRFSDESFFNSLKKQSDHGRSFSEKQIAALDRLYKRYIDSTN